MSIHKPLPGEDIADAIRAALSEARPDEPCTIVDFNGVDLVVRAGDDPEDLYEQFRSTLARRRQEWLESPEGRAASARLEQDRLDAIRAADAAWVAFEALDLSDRRAVLSWIAEHGDASDHCHSGFKSAEVCAALLGAGYVSNDCIGPDFDREDPDKVERYLIGQAIACLQGVGAIHRIVGWWCKDYLSGKPIGKADRPS